MFRSTIVTEDSLNWLVDWYARHCDGEWEHSYGIKIRTLDNPGWRLEIDLTGTVLENLPFHEIRHNYDDDVSWWTCFLHDKSFHAACGARDLASVMDVFREWAESIR
jgi:hypothetical protein